MRLIDGLALSYLPTIVSILVTQRNQRLGDLAADTVVIRDRREIDAAVHGDPPPAPAGDLWHRPALGRQRRLRRGHRDDPRVPRAPLGAGPPARARLAAQLDGALRPLVGGVDERDPERFLEILYDAKRTAG